MESPSIPVLLFILFFIGFSSLLAASIVDLTTDDDAWVKWLRLNGYIAIMLGLVLLGVVLIMGGVFLAVKAKKAYEDRNFETLPF